jgi:hypothetical protein
MLQAFFYDWIDRSAAKKGKPLPEKIGSMQYFLHGYTGSIHFIYLLHMNSSSNYQMRQIFYGSILGPVALSQTHLTIHRTARVSLRNVFLAH